MVCDEHIVLGLINNCSVAMDRSSVARSINEIWWQHFLNESNIGALLTINRMIND